ncbi:hypothetical protein H4S14_000662 [Agrobacterium vitis]|nr:hypothetical protein [Agrobacterium vitis]MBE1436935.1 hypothetical protein [Agrobacterium vitis]
MKREWTFTAESYLDQLSPADKSKVVHAVDRLPLDTRKILEYKNVTKVDGERNLYALRVGSDFQVLIKLDNGVISIVDVVRRGQVDGLRRRIDVVRQAAYR